MSGRGSDGRGRGSGSGGRGGGGRGQQPAGRGQQQSSRGGGSSRGRGRGANAPPPQSLSVSAAPLEQSPMTRVTSLSHEMEQKLTLQASSSTVVPASQPQVPAPQPQVPVPQPQVPVPQTQVQAVVAVNPPQTQLPPASTKAVRLPARPGFGTFGQKTIVKANHFLVSVADRDLNHYDVAIVPEVLSKKVCRMIMNQLVKLFHASHLGKRKLAYDGRKSCYTAGPLPFTSKDFVVKLDDDRREREFKVTIRFASKADLHHLREFLQGRQRDIPHETIQFLDVVLREKLSNSYVAVGRSFFHPEFEAGELGNGLEYWKGFYQSLRPTQIGLSLNIDMSARAFFEPILVSEFVSKYLNRDLNRPLSDQDRIKLKRALKGVKVENNHQGHIKHFKISGVSTEPTQRLMFPVDESGAQISVFQYFRQKYNIVLKYPQLPAIQAGSSARPAYLPMELCKIVEGQRYSKKLNERQVTQLLRATCKRPEERERMTLKMVEKNNYNRDELVNTEFGIQVRPELMSVEARVLPPPMLKYHDSGREKRVQPNVGQWNMMNKKMVNGGKVEFWTCINFSRSKPEVVEAFCDQLIGMCCNKGMEFGPNPLVPIRSGLSSQIEKSLKSLNSECLKTGKRLQLLLIILPDVTGSYGLIKRVCETELDIVSQCCQPKQASKCNIQYLENVSLKINVKAGGRNTVLEQAFYGKMPYLSDRPTIIFGADVTHPQPGEDSSPSIAAVVASMDWPEVTKYRGLVSAQAHREEIIQDLYTSYQDPVKGLVHAGLIRDHLLAFYKNTKTKPHRIVFYRDGVSEGQFNQVLLYEIDAIRKACSSLQADYQPKITFVVVQKRHHTRLFPADHRNRSTSDKSGNILPGTVVDTKICHPNEFDFYLCSHSGIQGTSRPAHYHVLYDENCFTADGLQILTNSLCYTYARCTRSVSIVPPAYYAHLAAFRARYYIEGGEFSDSESASAGPGGATRERVREVRDLPAIKENVKDVMFFC